MSSKNNLEVHKKHGHKSMALVIGIEVVVIVAITVVGAYFLRQKNNSQTNDSTTGNSAVKPSGNGGDATAEGGAQDTTGSNEGNTPSQDGDTNEEDTNTEDTSGDLVEAKIDKLLEQMSIEDKVAGLFVVRPEAITGVTQAVRAGETTKAALKRYPVGGLIYFGQNIQTQDQLKTMVSTTQSYAKYPTFMAIDEEGGTVSRLQKAFGWIPEPDNAVIGEKADTKKAYTKTYNIGKYLKEYGFNLDMAPVADVLVDSENTSIGTRSFGNDAQVDSKMIEASVSGFQEAGINCCVKHFPGLAAAKEDTHTNIVTSTQTAEEVRSVEMLPFQAGIQAGCDLIMVGHIIIPALDETNTPASLSQAIITGELREKLGYDGVVITDALDMEGITQLYSSGDAAIKAIEAGADMLLMPEDFTQAYEAVVAAVNSGEITEQRLDTSLRRIYRVKYKQ